jgi:3-deoxy-D-manno-octulosonic-acid transferase
MYGLYGALLRLAWAAVLPYQLVIALLVEGRTVRLRERLGRLSPGSTSGTEGLWIHAVSVGEVRLALSLAGRLRKLYPEKSIHLTTVTSTGREIAEQARRGSGAARPDSVSELPFDLVPSMERFMDRLRPCAILVIETEIWPNMLRVAGRRSIPVILVNGRVSPRAFPRYSAVRRFLALPLRQITLFAMQSRTDAERIRALGAPEDRIRVTGNLKFDLETAQTNRQEVRRHLRFADDDLVFVAGSTAPGEEEPVLHAFAALRHRSPTARLVMAPRHPRDVDAAADALREAGWRTILWSALPPPASPVEPYDALLVDVVGVLPMLYAACDLAFVGGSLVPRGGHNVMEPAALARPVLFGPYMENFSSAAAALTDAGAGFTARDGEQLAALVLRLATDPVARRVASSMALKVVETNRGAMDRTLALIEKVQRPASAEQRSPVARSTC